MVSVVSRRGRAGVKWYHGQAMETFSQNRWCELSGVDRRTMKKYLENFAPDKKAGKREQYTFKTVAMALSAMPSWKIQDKSGATEVDPNKLDPADRKNWYEAENKRLAYEEKVGELIPSEEVRTTVAEAIKIVVFALDVLPDKLEHEVGLATDQMRICLAAVDEARQSIAQELEAYLTIDTQEIEDE